MFIDNAILIPCVDRKQQSDKFRAIRFCDKVALL